MSSLLYTTSNYSFYAIPMAWVIAMAPHSYATTLSKIFDTRSPRTYCKAVENDQTIDKATKDKIIRCEAAQLNGFENLAFFASAVVAGNVAGIPASTLNLLSGGYLLSRVLYTIIYINNTTKAVASLRSLTWVVGIAQIFTLFIKSGNLIRNRDANLL